MTAHQKTRSRSVDHAASPLGVARLPIEPDQLAAVYTTVGISGDGRGKEDGGHLIGL